MDHSRGILEDLSSDDYTRCQSAARLARTRGYEAIRFPSATGNGEDLAIFFDQLDAGSLLESDEVGILSLGA